MPLVIGHLTASRPAGYIHMYLCLHFQMQLSAVDLLALQATADHNC